MTASAESNKSKTPGEELYLVHLRRIREEDDDHDYLPHKRRSSSVGEELWEVHRRRSEGTEDDFDRDTEETHHSEKTDGLKHVVTASEKKPDVPKRRYNLRSTDAPRKNS